MGALLISSGIALMAAPPPASAKSGHDQVCAALDSGKIDLSGHHSTYDVTAPEGMLISQYCVKAGSVKQGNGPVYVDVTPPVASLTISHPSGKDISHYSLKYVEKPVVKEAYADVQWIDPACGTKASFTTKSGDPVDVTWSQPSATPAPGVTVSLTATAMDGYTFDGSATKVFNHTYAAVVPPAGQTYDPATGLCTTTPLVSPPTTPTPQVSPPKAHVKAHVKAQTKTPTVVHAGLVTTSTDTGAQAGLGLVLAGLLLLAGAGGAVLAEGGKRE